MYAPYFVIQPYSTFITYFWYQFIIYILYIIWLNAKFGRSRLYQIRGIPATPNGRYRCTMLIHVCILKPYITQHIIYIFIFNTCINTSCYLILTYNNYLSVFYIYKLAWRYLPLNPPDAPLTPRGMPFKSRSHSI